MADVTKEAREMLKKIKRLEQLEEEEEKRKKKGIVALIDEKARGPAREFKTKKTRTFNEVKQYQADIIDVFSPEEKKEFVEKNNNTYRGPCPTCGTSATPPFVLFRGSNTAYCHKTGHTFNLLELISLKHGLITCAEGRTADEETFLESDLLKETFDILDAEYDKKFVAKVKADYEKQSADKKFIKIKLPGSNRLISDFASDLGKVLGDKYILFFMQETSSVVEILRQKQDLGFIGFSCISPNRFITVSEKYIRPYRYRRTEDGFIEIKASMSPYHTKIILESPQFQEYLPIIKRIFTVPLPIIYEDKLTFPKPGYDERFQSWLPRCAPKIINMNFKQAKETIDFVFNEFCFKTPDDKIKAIAGLISPFLRGLYSDFNIRAPVFFYEANRERAGKDYCAGITGILYEGHATEEPPVSTTENKKVSTSEELRKKLLSAMLAGKKRLHFSNNKGFVNNAVFEAVATSTKFSDRLLGQNKIVTIDNEIDFSLSGNTGITFTPDFGNRCRFVRLFLAIENANDRTFRLNDLHGWVSQNRSRVLSALYTFVKKWDEKGRPLGKTPFASFPQWAEICGGILINANIGDPCKPDTELINVSGDSSTQDMKLLFELCHENFGDSWVKKSEIKDFIIYSEEDVFTHLDITKHGDYSIFCKNLERYVGRFFSEIKLEKKPGDRPSRSEYRFIKGVVIDDKKEKNSKLYDKFAKKQYGTHGSHGSLSHQQKKSTPLFVGAGKRVPRVPWVPNGKIAKKHQKRPTTDREVQFWDAPECKKIVAETTKKKVYDLIKKSDGLTFKELNQKLGTGSCKFKNLLLEENKILLKRGRFYCNG